MHFPFLPALAVLPDLWTKLSISLGGDNYIIRSIWGKSSPLAATLVAIKHFI